MPRWDGVRGVTFNRFSSFTDPNIDIEALDIPVNAVATGLKDFFSKHFPPLFDQEVIGELEEIAGKLNRVRLLWNIR